MNISPEEAQASLTAIQQTTAKTRKAYGYNGYFLIVWGVVWFFGFLSNQFARPELVGWVWAGLVTVAWITSAVLGIYQARDVRSILGPRIGFFFMTLIVFTVLWLIILQPLSFKLGVLFLVTVILFGGIVNGVFTRATATIISCLVITVLALLGYYLLPAYFYLWVALTCGLPMIAGGVYMRLRWR